MVLQQFKVFLLALVLYENYATPTEDDFSLFKGVHNDSLYIGDQHNEVKLNKYFNLTELESLMSELAENYPDIVKVVALGQSSEDKRTIRAVQISHNVQEERKLLKPMVKLVANIRGDEAVGYALMVSLIQFLVYSDGHDDRVTRMLNNTDVWIVPTINPDGFARSLEGRCDSLENNTGAYNGRGIDLDRSFSHKSYVNEVPLQKETLIMSAFIHNNPFVLSANLQGGAIVATYPYDYPTVPLKDALGMPSPTGDYTLFIKLAQDYADRNLMMIEGTACNDTFKFRRGIVIGFHWREKDGSMQDFNYFYSNCLEVTLYVSCCKYPPATDLPFYWYANQDSLLTYIESVHQGIFGIVKDNYNNTVKGAKIKQRGGGKSVKSTERGEYWRLLLPQEPGELYTIGAACEGYIAKRQTVAVTKQNPHVRLDFVLTALRVYGTVTNKTGEAVKGAIVEIKSAKVNEKEDKSLGVQREKILIDLDHTGCFFYQPPETGLYYITVKAQGYRTIKKSVKVTKKKPCFQFDFILIAHQRYNKLLKKIAEFGYSIFN